MEEIKQRVPPTLIDMECEEEMGVVTPNLLQSSQVTKRSKRTLDFNSDTTTPPPSKKIVPVRRGFAIERFRWVKKSRGGDAIEMGKKWFLKMRNCSSHGRRFASIVEDGVYLDFNTDEVVLFAGDLIERAFLYFLKSDYGTKTSFECLGCDPGVDPDSFDYGQHESSCLTHENCEIDMEIVKRSLLKIPPARLHAGVGAISELYKISEDEITLPQVESYMSRIAPETFKKMICMEIEKEAEDILSKW